MTTTGKLGVDAFYGLKKFEAAHAGQLEIGDDDVERLFGEQLKACFGVGGGAGIKTFLGELQIEQAPHFWLRLRR